MLSQFYNCMTVEYLPVYVPNEIEKANPMIYAANVRAKMAEAMGAPYSEHNYGDVNMLRRATVHTRGYMAEHVVPKIRYDTINKVCKMTIEDAEILMKKFKTVDTENKGMVDKDQFAHLMGIEDGDPHYIETVFDILDSVRVIINTLC